MDGSERPVTSAPSTRDTSSSAVKDDGEDKFSLQSVSMVSHRWWQVHDFQQVTLHILMVENVRQMLL